ncbi:nuclear RNA export factor 5-like [Nannospalax galili]|uniref:nuclear RNA export factor 5-like n=1 Tax=Nannospalax galili TaxID=1026970 RepID=UPI00111C30C7|nr:nuclear RNA export factor 5-like [Nannospalax galili]
MTSTFLAQNDDNISLIKKDESFLQRSFGKRNLHGEDELRSPQLQENDGNKETKDVHEDSQVTDSSSTFKVKKFKVHTECQNTIPPLEEVERNTQDAFQSWYKITIPCGRKYEKMWILNLLQSHCSMPIFPTDFQYIRRKAQFFVQDSRTASELRSMNSQIYDEENKKIPIFVNASPEPVSVQYMFTDKQMQKLKMVMKKRYDVSQKALDLRKLRFDPGFRNHNVDVFLNRRSCMVATLEIIEKNFPKLLSLNLQNNKIHWLDALSDLIEKAPRVKSLNLSKNELKSVWELEKMKGLKLEELWLEANPLCSTFPNQSAYVNAVLKCFPGLLCLDGRELVPTFYTGTDTLEVIKPCMESYKGSETLKSLIVQFMLQKNLEAYLKDSRNMKRIKDPFLRMQLLKYTKHNIVASLQELPQTLHDFNSFVIDICFQTERMICFTVNGVFKELEGKFKGCIHAFTRTFILASDNYSSLCIVNDKMTVRNASPREIKNAFSIPMLTKFSSSQGTFTKSKRKKMKDSSTQTKIPSASRPAAGLINLGNKEGRRELRQIIVGQYECGESWSRTAGWNSRDLAPAEVKASLGIPQSLMSL